jgi:cytoskeletal protein CcmA (bactofilin family)
MSSRFQRSPLAGSDMLRRGDNLNNLTTRRLRLQSNDGSFPIENGIPRIADSDGSVGVSAATLTADGSAYLPGALVVEEGTLMNGTLSVRGATDIKGSADVSGKLSCSGITSTGVAIFNTNVIIQGDTIIAGPTQITGNSTIENLTINNEFITEGPVTINNNTTINGPTVFNDITTFNDSVTFNGDVKIPNDLTVDRLHVMQYIDDVTSVTSVNTDIVRAKNVLVGSDDMTYTPSGDYVLDVSGDVFVGDGARVEYLILQPQESQTLKDASLNPVNKTKFPKTPYSAVWMDASNNVWVGDHKIQMQHEIQTGSWFDRYLLAQPAAPTDPSDNKTSAEVLITWAKNPTQINASFMQQMLPRIAMLRVDYIGLGGGKLSITNTEQLPGTVAPTDAVRGIALVKGNGVSGVRTRTVNGLNVPVYIHYLGAGNSIAEPFDARIWYEGYGDTSRVEVLELKGLRFSTSSGPSVVRNISATDISHNAVTIGYQIPEYSDAVAQLFPYDATTHPSNPAIVKYYTTITPTASRRYGGAFNTTARSANTSALNVSFNNLFPDTRYSISTYATNTTEDNGTDGSGTFLTSLQPNLAPDKFINALNLSDFFPKTPYTSPIYSNGASLTYPVLYSSNGKITASGIGPLSIHNEISRGFSIDGIMSILLYLYNGEPPVFQLYQTVISVGGFGVAPKSVDDTINGIKISEDADSRSDPGSNETAGFYQTATFTVILSVAPGVLKTFGMSHGFQINQPDRINNTTFYTDDLDPSATPVVSGMSATRSSGTTMVAGIPISDSAWTLNNIGFSATNMGKYFHTENPITYSFADASGTLVLTLPANRANSTYSTSGLSISKTTSAYAYQPSLTITAKNTGGKSGSSAFKLTNILFDPASITKIALTRIKSPTSITDTNTTPFINNTIVSPHECILANGNFVGRGSNKFINYGPISGPDLSNQGSSGGIDGNGYRYVTLSFAGPGIAAGKSNAVISVAGVSNYTMYYRAVDGKATKWINGRTNTNINNINDPTYYGPDSTLLLGGFTGTTCLFPTPFTSNTVYVCVGIPDAESGGISNISISYG